MRSASAPPELRMSAGTLPRMGGTGGTVVPAGLLSKTAARASVEAEFR